MNDPFRHLQRLERELGDITLQLAQGHFNLYGAADRWRPVINAWRCIGGVAHILWIGFSLPRAPFYDWQCCQLL